MKKIHIVLFGTGNVGSSLIQQILTAGEHLKEQEGLELKIPVIANSTTAFFQKHNQKPSWETDFKVFGFPYQLQDVLDYVREQEYENLVAVDATASEEFVDNYLTLVKEGFHIVAANKVANTRSSAFYEELRKTLRKNNKFFLYETNVGAGLPVIETLRNFHRSHEEVTRIRGVFSGSLSYIFNTFCEEERAFSEVLSEASEKGFTEPDPRVDLSGKDVGRKLLILGRELGLKKELHEVVIQDLVPRHLNGSSSLENFQKKKKDLDLDFLQLKNQLKQDEVIRHVGELDMKTGKLEVKLSREKKTSALGSLQHADSSFEIFTKSYGEQPVVIKGAGAGAAVTARGVLTDLIKLAEKLPS
ncbi:homoserine dehydrogenase [Salinimicrobium catena]|uniref:Homoserine dehydrogenase n=1 Tax=Salinimicrobium catena TaxID=390640 RepID=A0A1H5P071_9FLAO|nr:aspartate kinase [Salinimicrobium catena]SDL63135.1 homoserine dehydrogenase [Salinimicrobium catena]SEF07309.1 homoserine dehydrogenase [Salinimicrobium catena]